jgi:hypothetical protein
MRPGVTLTVTLAAVLAIPSAAAARTVTPSSARVVSAHTAVSSCGSLSGITMSWTVVDDVVTTIVLGSIPSTCNGGSLSLTLVGSGNASLGTAGPVTVGGTSQTLTSITGSPSALAVTGAYLSVVGP